jgi:hypothetical protein
VNEFVTPVEIEVDGRSVMFGAHVSGIEYHISSGKARALSISSCINALRVHTSTFFPESEGNVNLIIDLGAQKRWWEPSWADLFITDMESYFDIEFIANAAIGIQDAVARDIVHSCVNGSAFIISSVEHNKE